MKLEGPFGIIFETRNRVVELEMSDGTFRYAVQLEDGSYYDQRWVEDERSHYGQSRVYRTWKMKKAAETYLAWINSKTAPIPEDLGFLEKFE